VIVLDTNVLLECLKPQPNPKVLAWMASHPRSALFTTTVVEAEILYGVRILPDGARKDSLRSAVKAIFDQDMRGRVIAFDRDCAEAFADIAATRRALGKPISQFDAMIAAATRSRGAVLGTRNVQDFIDCDIELIDPWR
jgi:hypothetical protein